MRGCWRAFYLLWCAWPPLAGWARGSRIEAAQWRQLAGYLALTLAAPLLWAGVDAAVTGNPVYSLHSTTGLAEALGRTQGISNIPGSTWEFLVRLDKLPLVLAAIVGVLVGVVMVPRRVRVPLALLASGLLTFVLLGAAGTSVIDRYLLTPAVLMMLFGALAIGGWSLLERGSIVRRVWMGAAALLVAYGVAQALATVSIHSIRTELAFRDDSHRALAQVLDDPRVRSDLKRCGPLSLPNHKLMPDARWILDEVPTTTASIVARSEARVLARAGRPALRQSIARGVAIYPTGEAVFRQAIVDANDDPLDQVPPPGWSPLLASQYYAVYVRCPSPPGAARAPTHARAADAHGTATAGWVKRWRDRPREHWPVLAGILVGALGLRVWGIAQGLPYACNSDENSHFAPRAVKMFEEGLNPHYFANPPAFTYLLHVLYAVWFGSGAGARHALALHPTEVFVLARLAAALLGTVAVWLLYLVGARLFDRAVGLLAAALLAVAFLPVFYAHLALNDVPTLAPLTLSLLGTAGVLRYGRRRDYLLAGVGLGVGCATKYTAGIVLLPLLAAAGAQYLQHAPRAGRRVAEGLLLAGGAALVGFLVANPYAVLDFSSFHAELNHQSQLSGEPQGKLGAGHTGGVRYYLWSLTWGLGWLPALAALGGAFTIWRRDRAPGLAAGARAAGVPRLHGAAGALLRALAVADLPDRVPARGVLRAGARDRRGGPRAARANGWRGGFEGGRGGGEERAVPTATCWGWRRPRDGR